MLKHKYIDKICIVVIAAALLITCIFINGESLGITFMSSQMGYETRLFERSRVHEIDIIIGDWQGFLETANEKNIAHVRS